MTLSAVLGRSGYPVCSPELEPSSCIRDTCGRSPGIEQLFWLRHGTVSGFSWPADKTESKEMFAQVASKSGLDLNGTINTGTANYYNLKNGTTGKQRMPVSNIFFRLYPGSDLYEQEE